MGSITALLNLTRNALLNSQAAIDVTANNIANQNTVGYTRQVVTFTEGFTVNLGSYEQGSGATFAVSSVRDRVLEQRVQQQTQINAQAASRLTVLQSVENIFRPGTSSSDASGIGTAISGFFSSFTTLQGDPTNSATRQAILSSANSLTQAFNSASSQLNSQITGLNQQVGASVSSINSLTSQIASLNARIGSESPNADAGALEDQRQSLITQLSSLVGVNQITTESNGISLTTTDGALLVGGQTAYALSTTNVNGRTQVLGNTGTSQQDITASLSGGSLGGLIQARDTDIPATLQSLDQLAYGIATAVNTQNQAGLAASGVSGSAIFAVGTSYPGAAGSISVSLTDPNGIAAAGASQGPAGTSNATAMAALANSSFIQGQAPSGFFASFLTQLGNTVSSATADQTTSSAALTQITTQRNALSGVSLDEEAANLTQYQRSYQAAAKVYSIVDQILQSALNLGVPTAVS